MVRLIPLVSFLFNQIQLLFKVCHVRDDILDKKIQNLSIHCLFSIYNTVWHAHHILVALPDLQKSHHVFEADAQGDHPGLDLWRVDLGCYERLDGHVTEDGQLADTPPDQVEMSAKIAPWSRV